MGRHKIMPAHRESILDRPECRRGVLDALRTGLSFESAAHIIGITRNHLYVYRRGNPEFEAECQRVIAEFEREAVRIVWKGAETDPRLALELISRRFPARWSGRTDVHVFGASDQDDRDDDLSMLSDETLERIVKGK